MLTLRLILLLSLAGAAGTLCRVGLGRLVDALFAKLHVPAGGGGTGAEGATAVSGGLWVGLIESLPAGTLAVNVVGSALFGVVWALADERQWLSADQRLVIAAGFLGALTTFSAYAYETSAMLRDGRYAAAGFNVVANNLLTVIAVFAAFWVTTRLTSRS